ncbi:hypothetical protein E4U42_003160 [Claviceps africana]|uniref:Major facilitator superfamily (MFS) profile domain-containing protein n=1 Tax=Claviceps africana TaxID=83212 RepID=A0A8K0J9P9_9HYPO|nr:hypothetical protein E4U42_003160 [Claviceps africana]
MDILTGVLLEEAGCYEKEELRHSLVMSLECTFVSCNTFAWSAVDQIERLFWFSHLVEPDMLREEACRDLFSDYFGNAMGVTGDEKMSIFVRRLDIHFGDVQAKRMGRWVENRGGRSKKRVWVMSRCILSATFGEKEGAPSPPLYTQWQLDLFLRFRQTRCSVLRGAAYCRAAACDSAVGETGYKRNDVDASVRRAPIPSPTVRIFPFRGAQNGRCGTSIHLGSPVTALPKHPRGTLVRRLERKVGAAMEPLDTTSAAVARRVLRRIDRVVIPVLVVTYMLNFMDKVILSSAAVFGLRRDAHLQGQEYSWVAGIFYFGYLVWAYPTTVLIARLPTGKYLAGNTLFWGAVVALTAACRGFGDLLAVRFLLGVAEATITPGFLFLTSTWYTRDEMPRRVGIWFAGNSLGGLVSSLMAFGVGHVRDHVHPWRWMYIILGLATFLWAIPLFVLLPDSISAARFLSEEERRVAEARVVVAGTGSTAVSRWKWRQAVECVVDPKTWFIFLISLLTQIPNGGTQGFSNIILESLHFTNLQSTLINIPYSLLSAGVIAGSGLLAGRFRTLHCLLIVAVVVPCVVGAAVIYCRSDLSPPGAQLFAYFLLATGPAAMPLAMSLVQANFRGVTKKMTMTAMQLIAYCAGNIVGPQLFRQREAPTYDSAFRGIMICYALAVVLALVLRFYLQWVNAGRVRQEGFQGSAGAAGAEAGGDKTMQLRPGDVDEVATRVQLRPADYEDVTDWEMVGFRYRL